jgi:hypothetical protein
VPQLGLPGWFRDALIAAVLRRRRTVGAGLLPRKVGTKAAQTRHRLVATLSFMATATTPWGKVNRLEEVIVAQRAGAKRFATRVELLETESGERLVRFSYATDGTSRRGPVTLRAQDLAKLRTALDRAPALGRLLEGGGIAGTDL